MQCSVKGCIFQKLAIGLCATHYQRWRRTGSVSEEISIRARNLIGPSVSVERFRGYRNLKNAPVESPTVADFHWAAGIYEGEGSIHNQSGSSLQVTVSQKGRWLLDRLKALFGGGVYPRRVRGVRKSWQWAIGGVRGRGFIQSIYGLLSPRRQKQALRYFDWVGESVKPRVYSSTPSQIKLRRRRLILKGYSEQMADKIISQQNKR